MKAKLLCKQYDILVKKTEQKRPKKANVFNYEKQKHWRIDVA